MWQKVEMFNDENALRRPNAYTHTRRVRSAARVEVATAAERTKQTTTPTTTMEQEEKKKEKKDWYVEQLSSSRMYYDDRLCRYSTMPVRGKQAEKKESERTEKKESIVRAATLSEGICCIVSRRHQCRRAKKTDDLMRQWHR